MIQKYMVIASLLICLPFMGACDNQPDGTHLAVDNLKCEFLSNPAGVEQTHPYFSWEIDAHGKRNVSQAFFRILVYESDQTPDEDSEPYWDSGRTRSGNSVNVRYEGDPLQSAKRYYWRVQIEDNRGSVSQFSQWAHLETGILHGEEWEAEWIYAPAPDSTNCPYVRYDFELDRIPLFAPAFVASVGFHELYVNGERAGDAVLTPSVSDLRNRALYSSYDLSPMLKEGKNNIIIWLASGWADFSDGNPRVDFNIDKRPLCKAQFKTGPDRWIFTNGDWNFTESNTYHLGRWKNSDFGGDLVDDSGRDMEWAQAPVEDNQWAPVEVVQCGLRVSSDFLEPNRMVRKRSPISIRKSGPRRYQLTMDSIYTGWIEASLKGKPGDRISISASSYPDKEVEFNQTNILVIGADGKGHFRNRFSYHQVEYVTIDGIDYQPELSDLKGYQVTNDRERYGGFQCSNALLNQIYNITCYTYESLSTGGMSVDCPHRERLGYGGDGHSSLDIALDAYASHPFFTKWAQDWVDIQDESGRINHTAPTLGGGGGPAWSGFILTMPWEVYLNYGNIRILENTFEAAQNWLGYLGEHINEDGLLDVVSAGDWEYMGGERWLFLGDWANPHGNEESFTKEASLFNNCYYVYVLKIASSIAHILGMEKEADAYVARALDISEATNRTFYDPENYTYIDTRQTHLVMPLMAGIVPEEDIPNVEEKLKNEILINQDGHFDTGIHGTYYLTRYFTERGKHDQLYTLMNQTTYPSFGEFISRGEITWPEYWHPVNSRVHGCLNGIGGWFQRGLLGIRIDEQKPGYKHIIIHPALIDSLQWAKGYHISPYGPIKVSWERDEKSLALEVEIPENTSASVYIPVMAGADPVEKIEEGGIPLQEVEGISYLRMENGNAVLRMGSGRYLTPQSVYKFILALGTISDQK